MNFLYIIVGVAGNIFGWWHDRDYSKRFIYYRSSEGNTWFTDEHGFLDAKRSILALAIEQGAAAGAFALAYGLGYTEEAYLSHMACGLGAGLAHYLQAQLKLRKRLKADRVRQIVTRTALKRLVTEEDRPGSVERLMTQGLRTVKGRSGRYWHPSVQWLWADADTVEAARRPIAEKLYDWLLIPESDQKRIWQDLKFHPKGGV